MANGGGVRGVHFRKMIYHRGWIEKAREKSVDPWGLVYRRGTRNREREREERREGIELVEGPNPHYHAPKLPSHYLVVPIARSNFITDSRTGIPP